MNPVAVEDVDRIHAALSPDERAALGGARVVVTGAGGFLGYLFLAYFRRHGEALGVESVVGVDSFPLGRPSWTSQVEGGPVRLDRLDVVTGDLGRVLDPGSSTHVVHLASIASPVTYRRYPLRTIDANVWGLRRLLDGLVGSRVRKLLFFSSSEIYGDPEPEHVPTGEEYPGRVSCLGPRAPYDEAKRFGETLCRVFATEHGVPVSIVRPFNNYGPGLAPTDGRAPADFAAAVLAGRDLVLHSDGSPTRTFCYVADAVAGYLKALVHAPSFSVFNIGMDRPELGVGAFAELFAEAGRELFGYGGAVRHAASEDPAYLTDNPRRRCPRIDRARAELGFSPTTLPAEGVRRYLAFLGRETAR